MKTILRLSMVAAFFFSTAAGMAKEPVLFFTNEDARSLIFQMDTPAENTALRFFDTEGNTIYSEKTGDVAFYGKKFDLKKLDGGLYFLEIEDTYKEIVYTIEVSRNSVRILEKVEKLKPIFRRKGKMLFLNLLNLNESKVDIKVVDSSNRVLFSESVEGKQVVEKAINFEKALEDKYTVVVSHGNDTYYENVLVD
jgi:hypothetical protein